MSRVPSSPPSGVWRCACTVISRPSTARCSACADVHRPGFATPISSGCKDTTEALGEIVGDLDAIQERAKLLQEELAGRALEETNRNMVILSVVTAVFMPVTLITGIFGMNVAGLPGLEDGSAFWWVMLGMAGVALMALLLLHWRRLL